MRDQRIPHQLRCHPLSEHPQSNLIRQPNPWMHPIRVSANCHFCHFELRASHKQRHWIRAGGDGRQVARVAAVTAVRAQPGDQAASPRARGKPRLPAITAPRYIVCAGGVLEGTGCGREPPGRGGGPQRMVRRGPQGCTPSNRPTSAYRFRSPALGGWTGGMTSV
jgi:hypothetical protein